ncbi:MAG: glycosyltransferase family protein [Planctomycetota bacterium]|jgi:glycosyltransferase involved in cell wall biosynthesis
MKIIHLWNTAGVGGLIARYMDRMKGTDSIVYMWDKWDPYHQATEKVQIYSKKGPLGKAQTVGLIAKCRGYDIIHNHGIHGLTPWLRLFHPGKRIILHYHGTRIRDKWPQFRKFWKYADEIIVSTPDLLEGAPCGVLYIPNLVDWDIINRVKRAEKWGQALTVSRWADDEAREIARTHGLELDIHDREANPVRHGGFLGFMAGYTHYIDIKRDFPPDGNILRAHSLTGLEAMALGLTVYNWEGVETDVNIELHRPDNVIPILWELYNEDFPRTGRRKWV